MNTEGFAATVAAVEGDRRRGAGGRGRAASASGRDEQLREAFPFDEAPRYLIRDNDGIYGTETSRCLKSLGIEEVRITPRSPWQNAFVERLVGTFRRELLDHVIVLNESHLEKLIAEFLDYYHESRPHSSLENNCPVPRDIDPPENGDVVSIPMVGGLHHCYRRAG